MEVTYLIYAPVLHMNSVLALLSAPTDKYDKKLPHHTMPYLFPPSLYKIHRQFMYCRQFVIPTDNRQK